MKKDETNSVTQNSNNTIVVDSYVHVITFYDYDHDIIKHIFLDEQLAKTKHKELQEKRTWGFYNLHKKQVE